MNHLAQAPTHGAIGENGRLYKGGEFMPFYKPRVFMPQIDDADYEALTAWLKRKGIKCQWRSSVDPSELQAHQKIDHARAMRMPADVTGIPALVASDGYVLDGNHRWYWHKTNDVPMTVLQLDADFDVGVMLLDLFLATIGKVGDDSFERDTKQ